MIGTIVRREFIEHITSFRFLALLALSLVLMALFWFVMKYTRWGLEMRAIGGNPQSARRNGNQIKKYLALIILPVFFFPFSEVKIHSKTQTIFTKNIFYFTE